MQSSITPVRQATRVCAFCRRHQHQQRRHIASAAATTIARNTQCFPPRALRNTNLAPTSRSSSHLPNISVNTPKRAFTHSARPHSAQSSTEAAAAETETDSATPQTHYDFFPQTLPQGPPPQGPFAIDVRALRREFLRLQASAHPDLHPAHLRSRAQATSARINEAFRTLESPLLRAQHVLSIRRGSATSMAEDETASVRDPELLALVLETREVIEDAESEEELEGVRGENEGRIRESVERLGELFKGDEVEEAEREVVRLRYWMNIRESILNWERGKGIVLEH
ncbi:Co-chaperone Hsc20 [Nemania sp. FL0916]|nr:Co-chaperone Hsc20 [Nemania sp. FL0916]